MDTGDRVTMRTKTVFLPRDQLHKLSEADKAKVEDVLKSIEGQELYVSVQAIDDDTEPLLLFQEGVFTMSHLQMTYHICDGGTWKFVPLEEY
ncbi:MAG: hypothetical protein CL678_15525 [Bdellovibrionaceae bacterium]|nr:hypothetical protein [Pseudobdellovibrionaceae bacterium]